MNSKLEINTSLKFNPYPGIETNVNLNKLSPKWIIVVGLGLVSYGLYLYLNQEKKEVNGNNQPD